MATPAIGANANQPMVVEGGAEEADLYVQGPHQTKNMYLKLKEGAEKFKDGFQLEVFSNAQIIVGLLTGLIGGVGKDLIAKEAKGNKNTYLLWKKNGENWIKAEWAPKITELQEWVDSFCSSDTQKGHWYPFIAAYQIANKGLDDYLFQSSTYSKELGAPSFTEMFAIGKSTRNNIKKSRPLAIGPLVHLYSLKRLQNTMASRKGFGGLSIQAATAISNRTIKHLKKQSIGRVQKIIIDQAANGDWRNVPLLCASYCGIKPHVERFFFLFPAFFCTLLAADLEGANFTDEWIWKSLEKLSGKIIFLEPRGQEGIVLNGVILSTFSAWFEDLNIMNWLVSNPTLKQRKNWGRYNNKATDYGVSIFQFQYVRWSKPQRGAPRSLDQGGLSQVCTFGSMRGKRVAFNRFTTLEELLAVSTVGSSNNNLLEMLNEEYEKYCSIKEEHTGDFYKVGSNQVERYTGSANPMLVYG